MYGVAVVYHPDDVPRFTTTVRQAANPVDALRRATAGTTLRYVTMGRDTFVVAPGARLTRDYARDLLADWRAGRQRSPDDEVGRVKRFTVGTPATAPATGSIARVSGEVFDGDTGESLVGANVLHGATNSGTTVELDGSFSLTLPLGRQRVEIHSVGYASQPLEIEVVGDGTLPRIELSEGAAALAEVVVRARTEAEAVRDAAGGLTRLDLATTKLLPVFSGDVDVIGALTRTAGVTATAEGSSAVSVRGGGLDANLVRQGGMTVLYPAHALGLFPLFHPDLIGEVELYRGYVPAELGGRSSSVIDVAWRTGDMERWRFRGGTGPLASRLAVEGPLWKDNISVIAGARRSHADWALAQQRKRDLRTSSTSFGDYSLGMAGRWATGSAEARGTYANDAFQYAGRFGFEYVNRGARLELRQSIGGGTSLRASASVSTFEGTQLGIAESSGAFTFTSGLNVSEGELEVTRVLNERLVVGLGAVGQRYATGDRELVPATGSTTIGFSYADPDLESVSAYATVTYEPAPAWRIEGGVRSLTARGRRAAGPVAEYRGIPQAGNVTGVRDADAEVTSGLGTVLQPRLRVTYAPPERGYTLGLAYSRLAQPVFQLSPTVSPTPADVFFVASEFLPVTTSRLVSLSVASAGERRRLQRFGYELSAYYRAVSDGHIALGGQRLRSSATPEQDIYTADGYAFGVESTLRYSGVKSSVEISYAYGRSFFRIDRRYGALRGEPGERFPSATDLPHQLGLTYAFRPSGRFSLAVGWALTSGRPYTGVSALVPQGAILAPAFTRINGARLPPTHRLDLSVNRENDDPDARGFRLGFGLSIYNAYARQNPYAIYYQRIRGEVNPYQFALVGTLVPMVTLNARWN